MPPSTSEPFPRTRRFIVDIGRAARRRHPVYALLEVDVTDVRPRLQEAGVSVTAYVVASVGRAVARDRQIHAIRDLRNRLVSFEQVDVNCSIEAEIDGRSFPMNHVIRDAGGRSVADVDHEIHAVAADPGSSPTATMAPTARWLSLVPGFALSRLLGLMHRLPDAQRRLAGTVGVSSVGMFGEGGGWGIPFLVHTLDLLVGGMVERPGLVDGEVVPRTYLQLTAAIDHDVVDGAPAARFLAELRRIMEAGEALNSRYGVPGTEY